MLSSEVPIEGLPYEYIARTPEIAAKLLALARHTFEHGVAGRFYTRVM
ncbi:MAG: hypothetical protein IT180_03755 [Acidobacteria bacterium]|nr:hypothetical protein [Acidobacteriota bacterium]